VEEFYLDDMLPMLGYKAMGGQAAETSAVVPECAEKDAVLRAIQNAFLRGLDEDFTQLMLDVSTPVAGGGKLVNAQHVITGASALMAAAGKGRADEVRQLIGYGADLHLRSKDGSTARDWAMRFKHPDIAQLLEEAERDAQAGNAMAEAALLLNQYQIATNPDEIDQDLLERLVIHICTERQVEEGAVLIFLTGWEDINRVKQRMEASPYLGNTSSFCILPLHSQVPAAEQRRVFQTAPRGTRKIILATNIAETSVTIDDVVCVINSGKHKEKSYDPFTAVSTLQTTWVSKASERQRRGRAGRVRPGECFHLYSKTRSASLTEFQVPELKRTPLEEICLQVKLLEEGSSAAGAERRSLADFLERAVEPPVAKAVENAVRLLEGIGALAPEEKLTRLGRHLAALPLPPATGKMLLYAILFGVLDPILTVACAQAYRSPFMSPMDPSARKAADGARKRLAEQMGGASDHLAVVAAFMGWEVAHTQGRQAQYNFQHSLSPGTMQMIAGMRGQLLAELTSRGLVSDLASASANKCSVALLRSVLAAGMYPQLGILVPAGGGIPGQQKGKPSLSTPQGQSVKIAPGSLNSHLEVPAAAPGDPAATILVAFDEPTRGEMTLYTRETTASHPHALFFVAGSMVVEDSPGEPGDAPGGRAVVVVDSWVRFALPMSVLASLCTLRVRLATAFAAKVHRPRDPLPAPLHAALQVIAQLLALEGGEDPQQACNAGAGVVLGLAAPPARAPGNAGGRGYGTKAHSASQSGHHDAARRGEGGKAGGKSGPKGGKGNKGGRGAFHVATSTAAADVAHFGGSGHAAVAGNPTGAQHAAAVPYYGGQQPQMQMPGYQAQQARTPIFGNDHLGKGRQACIRMSFHSLFCDQRHAGEEIKACCDARGRVICRGTYEIGVQCIYIQTPNFHCLFRNLLDIFFKLHLPSF
ncbi:hypothetical protein CYMTET_37524, partial [Cymbomonas tetramitiformis]